MPVSYRSIGVYDANIPAVRPNEEPNNAGREQPSNSNDSANSNGRSNADVGDGNASGGNNLTTNGTNSNDTPRNDDSTTPNADQVNSSALYQYSSRMASNPNSADNAQAGRNRTQNSNDDNTGFSGMLTGGYRYLFGVDTSNERDITESGVAMPSGTILGRRNYLPVQNNDSNNDNR